MILFIDSPTTPVMQYIANGNGGLFFLDGPGGTGKTYLRKLIQNEIGLAVASSGIAATLLDGGHTAHSASKLPLSLNQAETPTCNISKKIWYSHSTY